MSSGIKIEVGEYKTRGGKYVTVVAIVDSIAIGYFTEQGPESVTSWRADNGKHYVQAQFESCFDLVRKKPKRIKKKVWVTVYKDCDFVVGGGYDSLADAKRNATGNCIAIVRVEIDCMEGDGLVGSIDGGDA